VEAKKDRNNLKLKLMFEEIKSIVILELNQSNYFEMKRVIQNKICLGEPTIEKIMLGRRSPKSNEILQICIQYCDTRAKELGLKIESGSYKSRVIAAGKFSTGTVNPVTLAKTPSNDGVDLWTPGLKSEEIVAAFGGDIDNEAAIKLVALSEKCILEVAEGKFENLLMTAQSARSIGDDSNNQRVIGEANYLLGESLRLIADFTEDRTKADSLRVEAINAYESSIEELRHDPRPIRGRARTIEVGGDLITASKGFDNSVEISMLQDVEHPVHKYSYAHEQLRSIRHKLNCLSAIHQQGIHGTTTHKKEYEKIKSLVNESTKLHLKYLPLFKDFSNWWRIEWFMAEVLHAKALISIREYQSAALRLERAMKQRLEMMKDSGDLSNVERGNVSWWIKTAQSATKGFQEGQHEQLELILNHLGGNASKALLKNQINTFINLSSAPWDN
jgi:hypothetical protein